MQLDVLLVNEPQLWIESKIDNTLENQYKIGNARPLPIRNEILFSVDKSKTNILAKFALNKVDWEKLN